MALQLQSSRAEIKVISRKDGAIPSDLTEMEWELYTKTLEESHLRLQEEPTRFCLKLQLNYESQKNIQTQQLGIGEEGKPEMKLGFILEVIRYSLTDIINPPGLPIESSLIFTKDKDGFASKELIALLHSYGLVFELWTLREAAVARTMAPSKK